MKKNKKVLFDASAFLAVIQQETGYENLENFLASSCISSVNLSEVVSVLARNNMPLENIKEITNDLMPEVIGFTKDIALKAGELINLTSKQGLSLGDRACIATGLIHNLDIYTTDKIWIELNIENIKLAR